MGVIVEAVRTWPGALRSAHPQSSFAAIGRDTDTILARHELDCSLGPWSPLEKLEEREAKVLLLGVGFDRCTAFPRAEYRIHSNVPLVRNSFAVMTDNGRQWMTVQDIDFKSEDFNQIGAAYEQEEPWWVARSPIGAAEARLFPISTAVRYAQKWLVENRLR
jgi:aminoglycoside 3-N-acetyltransferase